MTTALEFVRGLGLGWNLGNTFDPVPLNDERNKTITTGGVWTPEDQQRLWFNKPFTRDCACFVKEAGFDTIRIPVTWKDWLDPYTGNVDPVWMAAVQEDRRLEGTRGRIERDRRRASRRRQRPVRMDPYCQRGLSGCLLALLRTVASDCGTIP